MATALGCEEEAKEEEVIDYSKIKHPLEYEWSFWLYSNTEKTWQENLIELYSFQTVEDFWCLYNYAKTPSELMMGQDYAIFKKGIRPMWEDPANKRGGRWLISFDKKRAAEFDDVWLYAVLMVIGENFDHGKEISGVVANNRVKSKVGLWVKNVKNKKAVMGIGYRLREQLPTKLKLWFQVHNSNNNIHTL